MGSRLNTFPGWRAAMQTPDRRKIYDWAKDNIVLPAAYAMPGPVDFGPSRYLMGPLDAVQDETVRRVSCYGAIQTGKSLTVEVAIPWAIANAPGPIMWTMQSDPDAKEQANTRFNELLRTCPPVAAIMPKDRHKRNTTETYFGNFYLLLNGANLNNLQSKSIRWKFNSEVWLWKKGLLKHAEGRVSKFEETGASKIFDESQGGIVGDDMDIAWNAGHRGIWSVCCERCGKLVPLEFFARCESEPDRYAGMVWAPEARREDGSFNVGLAADSARWKCKKCGYEHANTARTRAQWNASGEYVPENPTAPASLKSFRWNALVSRDFGALVSQWLEAVESKRRGLWQPMIDFHQKRLALAWKNPEEERQVITLVGSGYKLTDVAANPTAKVVNEVARILTTDRQQDHWWVCVRAWRADGSSRLLYYSRVLTVEQIAQTAENYGVPPQLVFEDAQHSTSQVYGDCVRFGWTALHGSGEDDFLHILPSGKKVTRFFSPLKRASVPGGLAPYVHWASEPIKDTLHELRSGKGVAWETPDDASEEYTKQIGGDAKREVLNKKNGRMCWMWKRVGPNHAWDCESMQVAAALMLRILAAPEKEVPADAKK